MSTAQDTHEAQKPPSFSSSLKYQPNQFPAFYFILLLQLGAYAAVAVTVLLIQLGKLRTKPKKEDVKERYSWFEFFLIGFRTLLSSSIASVAALCGAQALLHCPNLPVLAMLPVSHLPKHEKTG